MTKDRFARFVQLAQITQHIPAALNLTLFWFWLNCLTFFLQNVEVYVYHLSLFISTKSKHFALLFCIWWLLTHRLFVTLSLLSRALKHHVFISFSQFCLSILHCPMSIDMSKLYVPVWSSYFLFPIVHLLHQSYFFLGLYPLVLEAMIWTQWPWRDKPISWLISSVCFS